LNCSLVPFAIEAAAGITDNEVKTGAVTVNAAEPLIVPDVAVIVVPPCAMLVASPLALTVAVGEDDDIHVAVLVRSCVLPSL